MKRTVLMLSAALLSFALQAQVYEWFDEAGNRHFSDQKPEGVAFRTLGDPAANLSSYAPTAIRTPAPATDGDNDDGTAARPVSRASAAAARRSELASICADYLAQIDAIHDRLRAGYDEPTGNRLRAERSALRTAYRKDCN